MATIRQQIAVAKLVEIGGKLKGKKKVSMGKILKMAGFSDAVVKNPQKVTESKGWNELLEQYLPDKDIAKGIKSLLKAKRQVKILDRNGKFKNVRNVPDANAVSKGVEIACKIKKKYKEDDDKDRHQLNLTDEQLNRIIKD